MYKLYGSAKTRGGRVMWMLEELGAEYEVLDYGPHAPEVYEVNPGGKIPVLLDGDLAISDSTAILLHLADKHGELTFPVGSPERSRMMSVVGFAIDEVEQPLWTVAKHGFVLPEDVRALEAVTPACHFEWKKAMKTLGALLGDKTFVMGDRFTVPDIIIGHLGGWAKGAGFPAPEGAVADYMARIRSRPGWRAVVEARTAA